MARIEEQYNISVKPNLVRVGSTISSMDFEVYIDIAPNNDNYQFNPDAFSAIFNVDETHIAYDDGTDDPVTISTTEQSLVKVNDAYTRVILRSNSVNIGPINKPAKIYMRAVCSGSYEIESDDGYVTRQNVEFGSTYIRVTNSASDQTWTLKEDSIKTRVGDNAYNFIEGDTHGECTIQIADTSVVSHVYISGKELTINPSGGGRTNITVTTAGVPGVWNSRSQQFSVQVDKLTNWTVSPREMMINGNVSSMQTLDIIGGSITPAAKVGIYDSAFNFYESTVSKFGYIKNISLNKATRTITFSLDLNKTSTLIEQTTDRFWTIDDSTSMYSGVYQEIVITINPFEKGDQTWPASLSDSYYNAKSMNIKVEILPELSFKPFDVKINTAQGIQTAQAYVVIKDPRGNLVWRKATPYINSLKD